MQQVHDVDAWCDTRYSPEKSTSIGNAKVEWILVNADTRRVIEELAQQPSDECNAERILWDAKSLDEWIADTDV